MYNTILFIFSNFCIELQFYSYFGSCLMYLNFTSSRLLYQFELGLFPACLCFQHLPLFFFFTCYFHMKCLSMVHGTHHLFDQQAFYVGIDLLVGPVYCSRDPQTSFFSNFFIKNGSHSTLNTFKNYFVSVFLVFSFQRNKLYLNGP